MHETDIALLDSLKARMGVASRSEVIRVLIAKADPATVTRADAAALLERAS